ncbi:helix-turn-helix transcriptional regulator [Pedobacter miscanthi]|uniref:XRE family transcriptional regulator n=1 Tax=Pedobacter miscanthi TaxID=2259170 RepID=A0A366KNP4_9SPHI|nr:helix-turn-helix transcriptional regulator [Pedobacter miscanthi]RBQ03108.1 hypothetical protein DRW42_23010 [Pedobacter miscanthi]
MEENDFVSIWLEESGNPAIEELALANAEVSGKTAKVLADKGLTSKDLSVLVDINPMEIERWLSGRHTFSINVLKEISGKLIA